MPSVRATIPVARIVAQCALLIAEVTITEPVIDEAVAVMRCGQWATAVVVTAEEPAKRTQQQASTTGRGGLSREQNCGNDQQQKSYGSTHWSLPQTDGRDGGEFIGGLPQGLAARAPSDEERPEP